MIAAVIPCHREPLERIQLTLDSALAVPGIDHVVLVDDGKDNHALDELGVQVVHLPRNLGPAAAMNAGCAVLEPDAVIARLDVGDVFLEAKAAQLRLDAPASFSPHIDATTGKPFYPHPDWSRRIYRDGAFCICTAVFRRSVWEQVGGFDESLRYGDDWDFTIRVQHHVGWTLFPELTCSAGAFEGGHTRSAERDPIKRQIRQDCLQRVIDKTMMMREPERARHLLRRK